MYNEWFWSYYRRKFRSQTSDNMDRWKAEMERVREKRRVKREDQRRERVRRKKMQMREKVGKSRNTVFFQWFVAPKGRKVGSLKRRVRSHLARWEMKNSTPLWREAHFEVKMYKTPQCRTTFGSWDVEKVHAVVARSTFRSQNVQNTSVSDHDISSASTFGHDSSTGYDDSSFDNTLDYSSSTGYGKGSSRSAFGYGTSTSYGNGSPDNTLFWPRQQQLPWRWKLWQHVWLWQHHWP